MANRLLDRILSKWELPVEGPSEFTDSIDELRDRLDRATETGAAEILQRARELYAEPARRAEGVERRATTIQAALGIASSFGLAGGALLLDPQKVPDACARVLLALLFAVLIYCLVAAGYRSLQASSKIHKWYVPEAEGVLQWGGQDARTRDLALAAELLHSYGRNSKVADWKVAYLRAASEWFARALVALGVIAASLTIYVGAIALLGDSTERQASESEAKRTETGGEAFEPPQLKRLNSP